MTINYTIIDLRRVEIWPLAEIKNYLRISHDYDDQLLASLLDSAIESAELFTGISVNIKSLKAKIHRSASIIRLKHTPILAIDEVLLKTREGEQDVTHDFVGITSDGVIDTDPQYIGKDLEISFRAGCNEDSMPRAIKHGILMHISDMYENSDSLSLSPQVKDLYTPYRIMKI